MKYGILFFFFLICSFQSKIANAQAYQLVTFDKRQSQFFGANNLIALHKVLYSFQDKNIPDTLINENNFFKKTFGFGYRMTKLFLLDLQIDYFIALVQHEAFGHGARYREFGYKENSYHLSLGFPFGTGSGFARSGKLQPGYIATQQESVTKIIGGVEGNLLLANNIASQMLLNDTVHYRQALLYLIAQNNLGAYLWTTHFAKYDKIKPGNDMASYTFEINNIYHKPGDEVYDVEKLSLQSVSSLVSPLQLYSALTILYSYGIKGQKQLVKIPMIKFGNVRCLPALNYSLTPFGSQYHFINYVRYKHLLFSGDFNLGDNTFNNFYGISIKGFNLIDKKRIGLNADFHLWNQPELELDSYIKPSRVSKTGAAFKVDLMLRPFNQQNKLGVFLQMGYKAKGYITGEDLDETFILRYGISAKF